MKITISDRQLCVQHNAGGCTTIPGTFVMLHNDPNKIYCFDYYPEYFTLLKYDPPKQLHESGTLTEIAKLPYL